MGDPKKYRLLRLPWWLRGVIAGSVFGAAMVAYLQVDGGAGSLLFGLILAGVAGVVFGVLLTFVLRAQEGRIFAADGVALTTDERIGVLQAVDAGQWPQDVRLHPAAFRLVEQRLGRAEKPAYQLVLFGFMLVLALVKAVTEGPWWWLAVAFWLVMGPVAIVTSRRRRRSAQALRTRAFA